jgi:SCY1-like protein 2
MGKNHSLSLTSCLTLLFVTVAPEYALDELLVTASDMFSLGCVIFAVHCKGRTPFKTHGSLAGLRDNAGKTLSGIQSLDRDLQGIAILCARSVWYFQQHLSF